MVRPTPGRHPPVHQPPPRNGRTVTLFVDRCVMCSRCVRFTREITGTSELMVINRGSHEEIDVFPGYPLATSCRAAWSIYARWGRWAIKDFLYKQRVWFMKRHAGRMCRLLDRLHDSDRRKPRHGYRLKPRENPFVNKWWMCDEGRYGFNHVHSPERDRIVKPRRKVRCRGDWRSMPRAIHRKRQVATDIDWSQIPTESVAGKGRAGGRLAAVVSPI